jgi:AcrR family transcriptional regulator
MMAENGVDAVKIERLAAEIGVSKAPFYWRFKDRNALLDAILSYWRSDLTMQLIDKVAAIDTPRERLEALVALSLEEEVDGIVVSGIEGAIRAWAAQDKKVATFVAEVDTLRVVHVATELKAMGGRAEPSHRLAKAIYLGLIGLYTARRYTPELASDEAYREFVRVALDSISSGGTKR